MANTIKHKRGSGSNPSASDLVAGEIAIRTDTGVLFTKKDDNSVVSISGGSTDLGVSTTSSAVTVTSSTGDNATISEASSSAAGVMSTAHHDKLDGIEANATADQTAAEIRTLVESASDSNVFTDADHTKLNGIESGATADQTASEILTLIKTVDGSGSGLDADTLDGISSASFLRSDTADTMSGNLTVNARLDVGNGSGSDTEIRIYKSDNNVSDHIQFYNGTTRVGEIGCEDTSWLRINQETAKNIYTPRYIRSDGGFFVDGTSKGINGSGNFIGGTIAGASDYSTLLRSNAADTATGDITFSGGAAAVNIAAGSDIRFNNGDWTGNTTSPKINAHNNYLYIVGGSSGIIFRENSTDRALIDGDGHFRPATDNTYDLGTSSVQWKDGYFDGVVNADGINCDGALDISTHIRHIGDTNTYFGFDGTDQINFYTSGSQRLKIDSNGMIYFNQYSTHTPGLNNTTVGASFEALSSGGAFFSSRSDGPAYFVNRNSDGNTMEFRRSGSTKGSISINSSNTSFNTSSDYRLKENIVDLTGAITRVKQLQPKRFNFIADPGVTQDGFLAHEAGTVLPWAVNGTHNQVELWGDYETDELPEGVSVGDPKLDDDGNTIPVMQGMDYGKVTPLLTAALQEAIAKIETLETQNADLLARVTALEGS